MNRSPLGSRESVGEYGMSAAALVNSIEPATGPRSRWPTPPSLQRLYESSFADRLSTLSGLSPVERTGLWPALSGWELQDFTFRAYCPFCCLLDIRAGRTPYGRQRWLQSLVHSLPRTRIRVGDAQTESPIGFRDPLVGRGIAQSDTVLHARSVSRLEGHTRIRGAPDDPR